MSDAFNARFISNFSLDRLYHVTVERGDLYFIKVGGQSGVSLGVTSQFGLLGALLQRALDRRAQEKLAAKASEVDRMHPSTQLSAHKHNFHTTASAVEASSLDPPAAMGTHGPHFGRWRLKLREGKEMLFQLETLEDMTAAYRILPALGGSHTTNVVYDSSRMKFVKAARELSHAGS